MIGKLTGKVIHSDKNTIIIDVQGVGYKVTIPTNLLTKLAKTKQNISLFTYTYVREDTLALFGFQTHQELKLFEDLISISGIGARLALAILSTSSVDKITQAVSNADVEFFSSISGIGKKTAQRTIVDLKGKLGAKKEIDLSDKQIPAFTETMQALKQFGFSSKEVKEAISSVKNASKLTTEQLVKQTLKVLS